MKERGITLIALVVTIIILLILAGVTLSMALSQNGLFSRAQNAADKYKKAQEDEKNIINQFEKDMETLSVDYNDYVGAYVEGYKPTGKTEENPCLISSNTSGVSIGETINNNPMENLDEEGNQKFKTDEDMGWQIWDYDIDTKIIRLISDKQTSDQLTLKGATRI